jgi:hypothetical protein
LPPQESSKKSKDLLKFQPCEPAVLGARSGSCRIGSKTRHIGAHTMIEHFSNAKPGDLRWVRRLAQPLLRRASVKLRRLCAAP